MQREMYMKEHTGKLDMTILPWEGVELAARCFEYGRIKYSCTGWKHASPGLFLQAALRHVVAHLKGEALDSESGLPHIAHAAANLLVVAHHIARGSDAT